MRILFGYTPQRCLGTQASPPAFKEVRSEVYPDTIGSRTKMYPRNEKKLMSN